MQTAHVGIRSGDHGSPQLDELLEVEPSSITTMIDAGVHFEGKITVNTGKTVLISGKVTGQIDSNGAVIINRGGEVNGTLKAKSVQVAGVIRRQTESDRVDIEGTLVLAKGAKVVCDAIYGDLKADHGVQISGHMQPREMREDDVPELGTGTHGGGSVARFPARSVSEGPQE
jgi:cytoskeletal protein CcmA (bactofilin family)